MSVEKTTLIARNTLLLYGRMVVQMLVTMYASRIVLEVLGIGDNDIYVTVGSFVALFWFLNTAMASATQRFMNVEMERGDSGSVERVFSMSVNIHVCIALLVLLLGETVGLWFVNSKLVIAPERMAAAGWVYQLSLLTSCFNIVRVPYNASIVAHERMSMYALLTMAEAVLRLGAVWALVYMPGDKLVEYAALTAGVVLLMTLIYRWYCRRKFTTCNYSFCGDRALMRRMVGFSGWSLLGSGANAASQHGINLLFNILLGPGLNVAMGKATEIGHAVNAFVINFQTAFTPQIVKSYAAGDTRYYRYLIFRASKYSYFLLLMIAVPVVLCARPLVGTWLTVVPPHTVEFVQLLMCFLLVDAISGPLWSAVSATGRIGRYQIVMSSLIFMSLPLAWAVLKLGWPPESALVVRVGVNIVVFIARMIYAGRNLDFPMWLYVRQVVLTALAVTVLAVPVPWLVSRSADGIGGMALTTFVSVVWTGAVIVTAGMSRKERKFFVEGIKKRVRRDV